MMLHMSSLWCGSHVCNKFWSSEILLKFAQLLSCINPSAYRYSVTVFNYSIIAVLPARLQAILNLLGPART